MPESYTNAPRETRTLHAPWWSDAKDANGQWLERCEVWYPQLERDTQWINAQISAASNVSNRGSSGAASMSLAGMEKYRMYTLMRMVSALTNTRGENVLPPSNQDVKLRTQWWQGVPERDTKWIADELDKLNEPAAPTLDEDVTEAVANSEQNARLTAQAEAVGATPPESMLKETDPAALAEAHFRRIS